MLSLIVFLPIIALIAILFGAPARFSAMLATAINLALGIYAACTWKCSCWASSITVLEKPNIHLSFGITDGMSVILLLLAVVVSFAATYSGSSPAGKEKLYFGSSLLISSGAIGAFLSTDLFFFFAFHELALIPTFLMIGMLGRGDRKSAAWKITIYLGLASMILLAGLVWLANLTGSYDIATIISHKDKVDAQSQIGIAALLLIGFGTLVSLFPFHSWAAPAYASAPAPVAMLHSGVLKKFGLYGLLRIAIPVLPQGLQHWLMPLLVLLLGNILWVGYITVSQRRLDRMLGNSSVMHMGYIFLAIAALIHEPISQFALPAALVLMFAHGISIALLFSLADVIERKTGSLDFADLGGLAKAAPTLAFVFGIGAMASIGMPGLANFAGELMVFIAAFSRSTHDVASSFSPVQITCMLSVWGMVISAIYMLRAYRNIFQAGTTSLTAKAKDISKAELVPATVLIVALLAVGLYPNLLIQFLK